MLSHFPTSYVYQWLIVENKISEETASKDQWETLETVDNLYIYCVYHMFSEYVCICACLILFFITCHLMDFLKFLKCTFLVSRRRKDELVSEWVYGLTLSYRWEVTSSSHLEKEEMYIFHWILCWSVLMKNNTVLGNKTWS